MAPQCRRLRLRRGVAHRFAIAGLVLGVGCSEYNLENQGEPPKPGEQPDALQPGEIEDVFVQRTAVASDILFVVDDSGSMGDEQENLAANFGAFAQFVFDSDIDFHLGVVPLGLTGDVTDGELQLPWVDPSTTAGEQVFQLTVRELGTDGGSGCESGLQASYLALTEPKLSAWNTDFYREEAMLTVVVVSDENDNGSIEECRYPTARPEAWAPWLLSLKPDPDRVNFGVIAGFDPADNSSPANCSSSGLGDADAAPIYGRARDLTGGTSWSICNEDWTSVLADLGLAAAGLTRQYDLTRVPATEDGHPLLQVWLDRNDGDGFVEVQPVWADKPDADNPWDYDPVANAVVWTLETMPEEGWTVRALYPNSEEA